MKPIKGKKNRGEKSTVLDMMIEIFSSLLNLLKSVLLLLPATLIAVERYSPKLKKKVPEYINN